LYRLYRLDQVNNLCDELVALFDKAGFEDLLLEIGKPPDTVINPADLVSLTRRPFIRKAIDVANREGWISTLIDAAVTHRPTLAERLQGILGAGRPAEIRQEGATHDVEPALDKYLGAFQGPAADPGESTRDEWGIIAPFVDLKWVWSSSEQVNHRRRKWTTGSKLRRTTAYLANLLRRRPPKIHAGASQVLSALLGHQPHPNLKGGPEKVPWLVHVGPGGGKTTLALRALAELAKQFRLDALRTLLPVYLRLASFSVETLRERLQASRGPDGVLALIRGLAGDHAGLIDRVCQDSGGHALAVVMDGLDEIPDTELRRDLLDWLVEAGAGFCVRNSLVITCRTLDVPRQKARRSKLRLQYMYVLPIDGDWQDEWCRARCEGSEPTARWLLSQVERLRQNVLDDVRTTRGSFLSSPYLFTNLMKWLLDGHWRDDGWVPNFPRNSMELTSSTVDLNLREAAEYAVSSLPGPTENPAPDTDRIRETTLRVLSRLAFDQLAQPAEGWDVDERQVLRRLDQEAAVLPGFEQGPLRLAFEKSRLLTRVDIGSFGGTESEPRRAFAHPLILEYLGSRYLADALGGQRSLPEASKALSSVWIARRLPDAVRMAQRFTLPGAVVRALMAQIVASDIHTDLDVLTSSDASAIFFELVDLALNAGKGPVEEGERYRIAVALMTFLSWRGFSTLAEHFEASVRLVCQWLEVGNPAQVSESAGVLGHFAGALRAMAEKKERAKALAMLFEKVMDAPAVEETVRQEIVRRCAERLARMRNWDQPGSGSWPNQGSSRAAVEALRPIESNIKRAMAEFQKEEKRRSRLHRYRWFPFGLAVVLLLWWGSSMYTRPPRFDPGFVLQGRLVHWVQFVFCGLWAGGYFLLGTAMGLFAGALAAMLIHSMIEGTVPRVFRRFRNPHWLAKARVMKAVRREEAGYEEAEKWIEAYGALRPGTADDVQDHLAFLAAMQQSRMEEGYSEEDARVLWLKAAADRLTRGFQSLRELERQGHRPPAKGQRQASAPKAPEAQEVLARDQRKYQLIDFFSPGVAGIAGLLVYRTSLAPPIQSVALAVSLGLGLLLFGCLGLVLWWDRTTSPAVHRRLRGLVICLEVFRWVARLSIMFAALMLGLRAVAEFPDSVGNLHSNWFAKAIDSSQEYGIRAGMGLAGELCLLSGLFYALSRLALKLPSFDRFGPTEMKRWWTFAGPCAIMVVPVIGILIATGKMTPDPEPLLRRQETEIRDSDPESIAHSLEPALSELRLELGDIHDGAQPNPEGFQKSLGRYLDALDARAKRAPDGMATILWFAWEVGDSKNKRSVSVSPEFDPLLWEAAHTGVLPDRSLAAADRIVAAACRDAVYDDEYQGCRKSSLNLSRCYEEAAQHTAGRGTGQEPSLLSHSASAWQRADAAAASQEARERQRADAAPVDKAALEWYQKGEISRQYELLQPLYEKDRTNGSYAADLVESLVLLGRPKEALALLPEAFRLNRRSPRVTMILLAYQAIATDVDGNPEKAAGFARQAAERARSLKERPGWDFSGALIAFERTPATPKRVIDLIQALDKIQGLAQGKDSKDIAAALDRYVQSLEH